jgi:hypothetical protein
MRYSITSSAPISRLYPTKSAARIAASLCSARCCATARPPKATDGGSLACGRKKSPAGRARPRQIAMLVDTGEFVRLERRPAPGWYWIARDGGQVRVGCNFATAEQLQPGFLEAMSRAGAA